MSLADDKATYASFTPEAIRLVADAVRQWGVLSVAARAIGMEPGVIKALMRRDPDLRAEIETALDEHKDMLYAEAVQRGTAGKSDALLSRLLEAQMPSQFDPKARNAAVAARGKPTGVRLRQFEATDDGQVQDVTPKGEKPAPDEPLKLGYVGL